jgi:hypothetical protein
LYRSHPLGEANSVCLHRAEASTRSLTRIEVTPHRVRLIHTPGPPCATAPLPAISLPPADDHGTERG